MKTRKEVVVERLIKWCDLHGVVVGGPIYNGMKLFLLAESDRSYKEGMMRSAEIAEKIYSDCSNGTPSFPGKHKVAVDVAQAIRKEAQGE